MVAASSSRLEFPLEKEPLTELKMAEVAAGEGSKELARGQVAGGTF